MSVFGEFHFLRPIWLTLIPVVVAVWWFRRRWTDPLHGWRAVMDPQLLKVLTVGDSQGSGRHDMLLLTGWLLAALSLAGPTWKPEPSPFADDPVPVMILLRAGETMDLADLSPSRMERARLKVVDFANARRGQPTGLIAWSGTAHLVLPPTRDTSVVASMAMEISPEIMPRSGDDLTAALQLAASTLGDTHGSLLVVADTVSAATVATLDDFTNPRRFSVHLLGIARADTPEMEELVRAASILDAQLTPLSPDTQDVESLARSTARVPVSVSDAAEGVRWSEAGWWLVPILTLMSLAGFRRVEERVAEETAP